MGLRKGAHRGTASGPTTTTEIQTMTTTKTLLRVTLPSGNPAVYEVQPQHLNEQPGTTLAERARWFGRQVAVRLDGNWYRTGRLDRIEDPRTVALLENCTEA